MPKNDLIIRLAGEGGDGVISAGDFIAAASAKAGLEIYTFKTFPAEIRGGYAMYQVRISPELLYNQGDRFDVFCCLNIDALNRNRSLLTSETVLIYDATEELTAAVEGIPAHCYPIPMTQGARDSGNRLAKNLVAMGALSTLFNIPQKTLEVVIEERFKSKGIEVYEANVKAFRLGQEAARALTKTDPFTLSDAGQSKDVIVISGNEAIGLGAIIGKLDFFSAYPITPATEIAKYVATHIPKMGGTLIQAEDEISSISQVLGASFAGKRAMTATSGPGLSLMSEMVGMAGMSETPVMIANVQRGGPSTGLPTKHEQSDLFLAIHGSHGDCPRIVLSVENVADCISMTVDALNMAEAYQCPVILLSDGSLAFSNQTIPYPDPTKFPIVRRRYWDGKGEYKRYLHTEDGISPMVDPGTPNGMHIATGLEHNEKGAPQYDSDCHEKMQEKRFIKMKKVIESYTPIETDIVNRKKRAPFGIIAWGSTIGVVREAIKILRDDEGIHVNGFYPKLIWPMPVAQYDAFSEFCEKIIVPEVNHQGQLAHFIRSETSLNPISYPICGGLPFTPAMIVKKVKELMA